MVEANVEKKDETPQPQEIQSADEIASFLTDALDKKHALSSKALEERIVELKKLKEKLSVISLEYSRIEDHEQTKMKDVPVFNIGAKTLTNMNLNIIQALEADISRHEKEIEF